MATCGIFPFLFPTSWGGLGLFGSIHAPRDLLSAHCSSLVVPILTDQRYSEMNTPADAEYVMHWKLKHLAICLRQGYAFATNTLPGNRSIFFPVESIGSGFPASRPPEFSAGDDKCNDTVPDGGVYHAPYGRQQQAFREFAKIQKMRRAGSSADHLSMALVRRVACMLLKRNRWTDVSSTDGRTVHSKLWGPFLRL